MRTHIYLAGSQAQKEPPRNRIVAVDSIQYRGLRIESQIAANSHGELLRIPDVTYTAESVSANPKRSMLILDAQEHAVTGPQQFVLINQLKARIEIVLIEKVHR